MIIRMLFKRVKFQNNVSMHTLNALFTAFKHMRVT